LKNIQGTDHPVLKANFKDMDFKFGKNLGFLCLPATSLGEDPNTAGCV